MKGDSRSSRTKSRADERTAEDARFRLLVDGIVDCAVVMLDANGIVTTWNTGAERLEGYRADEIVGRHFSRLYTEEDIRAEACERELEQAAGTGRFEGEGWRVRKDGSRFWAGVAITALRAPETDRLLGFAKITHDLTERRESEHERARERKEQAFLADVSSVLASSLDYERTLTSVAELAVRDLADMCFVDLVEEDGEVRRLKVVCRDPTKAWLSELLLSIPLDRKFPHLIWSILETGKSAVVDELPPATVAALLGDERTSRAFRAANPKSVIAVPLLAHGRTLGAIFLVSSDPARTYGTAELRLAEELARRAALAIQSARLYRSSQRAIRARDDVLGIVAHDLRNPLGIILMQTQLLWHRRPAAADANGRSRKPLEAIERAAKRMSRIIQDLLDVTSMEAGRLSITRTHVSGARLVSDAVQAQALLASSASIALHVDVADDTREVFADRDRLLQVFENLIGNAVKFTEHGGHINVGLTVQRGEVVFFVTDTGIGIATADLPHVFDRFWQARLDERRGAGLGLAIAKGIVEAHGGRMWVESAKGRGSSFFFSIPTAPPTE